MIITAYLVGDVYGYRATASIKVANNKARSM